MTEVIGDISMYLDIKGNVLPTVLKKLLRIEHIVLYLVM